MSPAPVGLDFRVEQVAARTGNVEPLLHEIRHALANLLNYEQESCIDLRSLPLAPGEQQELLDILGQGEVSASLIPVAYGFSGKQGASPGSEDKAQRRIIAGLLLIASCDSPPSLEAGAKIRSRRIFGRSCNTVIGRGRRTLRPKIRV